MSYREVSLRDIVDTANTGLDAIKRAPIVSKNTGIKCLRIQDISQNKKYNDWGNTKVDDKNYKKFALKKHDIIIARTGATVGVNLIIKNDLASVFNNGLIRLRSDRDICEALFLHFVLQSNQYKSHIQAIAFGTTSQPNMKINSLLQFKLKLPPLPIQTRIASILSAFDEKIELNRQMNATLEAMAQAMFREMCLPKDEKNLEEGWEWKKIGDIGKNKKASIKPEELNEDDKYIGLGNIPRKQIAIDSWENASEVKSNKYSFSANDILFGKLRPYFHKVGVVPISGVCSTDILVIQPKKKEYFGFLLMHCFSEELVAEVNASSTGTRMPRTNWKALARYEIALPPNGIIRKFNQQVSEMIAKMNANTLENQELAKTRDLLLPKLMSGEIAV